jgi:rhamnose utilization protein RhaD (predicted bifunctional aldolase and dehydrogenase)
VGPRFEPVRAYVKRQELTKLGWPTLNCPEDLIDQAIVLGSNKNYVQGAGGNLSVKESGILWIKASGMRLSDASQKNIFVPMDWESTKGAVLVTEDLQQFCLPFEKAKNLKPSIETAIHSLLPHRHIAHVHSLGAIATSILVDAFTKLEELEINAIKICVPYAKPGIPLANLILRNIINLADGAEIKDLDVNRNLVVLLGNHGLIVAGEDIHTVRMLIEEVENNFFPIKAVRIHSNSSNYQWIEVFPPQTLNLRQIHLLTEGALTPDEVVFLGSKPFTLWNERTQNSNAAIKHDGSVWTRATLGEDAIEIVESLVNISLVSTENSLTNYLSQADVDELLNWDAEKWRKDQER